MRFAFAAGVWARTSDLRRLFRCLTLGAAVLARRCHARTERVCTLFCFLKIHFFPPNFGSRSDDPSPNASLQESVFLCRKEHLAIVVRTVTPHGWQSVGFRHRPGASLRTAVAEFCGRPGRREQRGLPSSRVSNCGQMFAGSSVIIQFTRFGREAGTVTL